MIKVSIQCLKRLIFFFIIFAVSFHANMICTSLGQPVVPGASSLGDHHMLIAGFLPSCCTSRLTNLSAVAGCVPVTRCEDAGDAISNSSWSHCASASGSQGSTLPYSTKPCCSAHPSTQICSPGQNHLGYHAAWRAFGCCPEALKTPDRELSEKQVSESKRRVQPLLCGISLN